MSTTTTISTITIPPIPYCIGQTRRILTGPYAGKVALLTSGDEYRGLDFWCEFTDGTSADWVAVSDMGDVL